MRLAIRGAPLLGAALVSAGQSYALQATRSAPLRVERAEIMDRRGFEKPLLAYTLLVPVGWRGEGEVEYPPYNGCNPPSRLNWRATSPDGVSGIQIVPEEQWSFSTLPQQPDGCLHGQASSARQYLEWWVQRHRPGARVLDFRARPDLAQPFQHTQQEANGMRSWVDAGEILIAYQHRGRQVREAYSNVIFFIHTRFPVIDPTQPIELLQGLSAAGFAMRMPDGALDFKAIEALRKSVHAAPEWKRRMIQAANDRHRIAMQSNAQIAADNRRAAAERARLSASTAQELNDIQMGTWQSRNESMDRTQREAVEAIRGVETYADPHYGGSVQLSSQYQDAWQLRDGSYVLTDDPTFDPARLNLEGQRLKPVQ